MILKEQNATPPSTHYSIGEHFTSFLSNDNNILHVIDPEGNTVVIDYDSNTVTVLNNGSHFVINNGDISIHASGTLNMSATESVNIACGGSSLNLKPGHACLKSDRIDLNPPKSDTTDLEVLPSESFESDGSVQLTLDMLK